MIILKVTNKPELHPLSRRYIFGKNIEEGGGMAGRYPFNG